MPLTKTRDGIELLQLTRLNLTRDRAPVLTEELRETLAQLPGTAVEISVRRRQPTVRTIVQLYDLQALGHARRVVRGNPDREIVAARWVAA